MQESEELAVIKAYYRVIENLETINHLQSSDWAEKTLTEAKAELKKFRGY